MHARLVSLVLALGALAVPSLAAEPPAGGKRPNILWIVSEDNDPFLGCYGDRFARTPNLDKLAAQGVLYTNAFANAPVCAPSRSTLITGVYSSSLGTMHMRSQYRIPEAVRPFPQYLREAGYWCVNPGKKTDFNFSNWQPARTWDGNGDWTGRKPGQPFFCVFNFMTTHESCLHGSTVHEEYLKEPFQLPPYHPDTPEIRSNWVEYYHKIAKMDGQVGEVLDRLAKDGLADDTIVFYYSDHGGILPRGKRYCYDSGLHVPLLVRFGRNFQHLAPARPGTKLDRLVSFVDLAPSVLGLAGLDVPAYMQGQAFLGPKQGEPRPYVYGFRNRMDERYDLTRTVRDAHYRYARNYQPHRIYGQHLDYLWKMPATVSWEKAYKEGKCNATQSAFWQPKPTEELYDLQADPYEINNLADKPEHKAVLERLRQANRAHLLKVRDAGFLPEAEMTRRAGKDSIREMALDDKRYPLERILTAAELASQRDPEALPRLIELMKDGDAGVRYWAAVGCCVRGEKATAAAAALRELLKDPVPDVRIAAAEALCLQGHADQGLPALIEALALPDQFDVLPALNALEALGDVAKPAADAVAAKAPFKGEFAGRAADWLLVKWGKAPAPKK